MRALGFADRFASICIDTLDELNRRGKHGFFQDILARMARGPTKCLWWGSERATRQIRGLTELKELL